MLETCPIEPNEYVWELFETRRMYRQGHCRRTNITISNPEVKKTRSFHAADGR